MNIDIKRPIDVEVEVGDEQDMEAKIYSSVTIDLEYNDCIEACGCRCVNHCSCDCDRKGM